MNRFFRLALLILTVGTMMTGIASAANYYVAANGSDSNSGTSNTSPWLHAPGMPNCSAVCASANPQPGDRFIFRGGDTWTAGAQWNWNWSGTSTNQIYIGVDQTWYTGSSWARPILNGQGSYPGASGTGSFLGFGSGVSYVTVDNLGWTGLNWTASAILLGYIGLGSTNVGVQIEENYFHGWTHGSAPENNSVAAVICGGGGSSTSNRFFLNVVDGSDTAQNSFMGIEGSCVGYVYENEFKDLIYGVNGSGLLMHDNVFDSVGFGSYDGVSHTGIVISNIDSSPGFIFYNNVTVNGLPGLDGGVSVWQTPLAGGTSYAFNNVSPNGANIQGTLLWCGEFFMGGAGGGTCTWFNNTVECGPNSDPANACFRVGSGQSGPLIAGVEEYNTHAVGSATVNAISHECTSACPVTTANLVPQTEAVASAQGYSIAQPYAFSPTASGNATVGAGENLTSLCATISGIDAGAGTACLSDTTYAVSYNTSNHTVSYPARTPVARPATGAWDVGAYQFANGQPSPPTGLSAAVN